MTTYREYRGLFGEPVRVPTDSIAPPLRFHARTPFPFATIAERAGGARDSFAGAVSKAGTFFHSAAVNKTACRLVGHEALAAI